MDLLDGIKACKTTKWNNAIFGSSEDGFFDNTENKFFISLNNIGSGDVTVTLFDIGLSALSLTSNSNRLSATITVGTDPFGLAYDSFDNRIYVANFISGTVSIIDCTTNTVIAGSTVTVGSTPRDMAYNSTNNSIYVTNAAIASTTISVIASSASVVITTNTSYTALVNSALNYMYKLKCMDIFASNNTQLMQPCLIQKLDVNGNINNQAEIPYRDMYAGLNAINGVKLPDIFVLDGFTTMQTTILSGQNITYYFSYDKLGINKYFEEEQQNRECDLDD